jgi:hypothetical protein
LTERKNLRPALVLAIVVVLVVVAGVIYGRHAVGFFANAYPQDRTFAEALDRCAAGDPQFVRFSERARQGCYLKAGVPTNTASAQ